MKLFSCGTEYIQYWCVQLCGHLYVNQTQLNTQSWCQEMCSERLNSIICVCEYVIYNFFLNYGFIFIDIRDALLWCESVVTAEPSLSADEKIGLQVYKRKIHQDVQYHNMDWGDKQDYLYTR